jgi:mRNA interferase MazF
MLRIVYVNFPFIDNPHETKQRPALCLTKPIGRYKITVVAYITTKLDEALSSDINLEAGDEEFTQTGLKRSSYIRTHKLYSVVADEIVGELGVLPQKWEHQVKDNLRHLLDL